MKSYARFKKDLTDLAAIVWVQPLKQHKHWFKIVGGEVYFSKTTSDLGGMI